MTTYQKIKCPECSSFNLKKNGETSNKKQRYRCRDCGKQFIVDYQYQGSRPEIRRLIVPMTMNSSGIRDIARVLHISTNTVIKVIGRAADKLAEPKPPLIARRVEMDEFWSFIKKKRNQRWTWYGITSSSRRIGAFVNGRRTDAQCRELLRKYAPSRIKEFASDDWQSYQKAIPTGQHRVGKEGTRED